uniref:Uncharacterized protein n=1 Tax=Arundo donax TaxID=35708 RepID=A0A0A8XZJ7_ARUDO
MFLLADNTRGELCLDARFPSRSLVETIAHDVRTNSLDKKTKSYPSCPVCTCPCFCWTALIRFAAYALSNAPLRNAN